MIKTWDGELGQTYLTGKEVMRLRNEQGGRKLGHNKENEGKPEALHDFSHGWK